MWKFKKITLFREIHFTNRFFPHVTPQSTASSMRFQDAFFTTQGERKRQRTPNSRFQRDFVALPGLRATCKSTWEHRSHKGK